MPLDERKEALRWLIRDLVSYPVDNACLDVLEIPSEGQPPGRPASVIVVSAGEAAVRARITHCFTHFTWQLEALAFHAPEDQKEHLAIELNGQWLSPESAAALGIPAAMKKLISAVNL